MDTDDWDVPPPADQWQCPLCSHCAHYLLTHLELNHSLPLIDVRNQFQLQSDAAIKNHPDFAAKVQELYALKLLS
jgi:hypothetical protein